MLANIAGQMYSTNVIRSIKHGTAKACTEAYGQEKLLSFNTVFFWEALVEFVG